MPLQMTEYSAGSAPGYTGRFAPSPSGALHFGSLVTALGSYLQARHLGGRWLLRIDDIDPPREVPGAADAILRILDHYGLHWDGSVLYQSRRHDAYRDVIEQLKATGLCYYCTCTRHDVHDSGGHYPGTCRQRGLPPDNAALRLIRTHPVYHFTDGLRGDVFTDNATAEEDIIIFRKDKLFAYNLVVVLDDDYQGVTEVVRGADLLYPTSHQLSLYRQLRLPEPHYLHLPLMLGPAARKLSKQNHATPVPLSDPRPLLWQALQVLRQPLPETDPLSLSLTELLAYSVRNWDITAVPRDDVVTDRE